MSTSSNSWSVKLDPRCKSAIEDIRQAFPDIPTHAEAVAVAVAFTYQAVCQQGLQSLPTPDGVLPANEDHFDE